MVTAYIHVDPCSPDQTTCKITRQTLKGGAMTFRGMKVYRVHANGQLWKVVPEGFSFVVFETGDRRIARKAVRMARRLGYILHF